MRAYRASQRGVPFKKKNNYFFLGDGGGECKVTNFWIYDTSKLIHTVSWDKTEKFYILCLNQTKRHKQNGKFVKKCGTPQA